MAIQGKDTLTLRKRNTANEKRIAVGFTKLQAWHKATAGETGIDLLSLNFPSEIAGATNPSNSKLAQAQLRKYAANVTIRSSLRGVLMRELAYTIPNATRINWLNFTSAENEIFEITIDHEASTELSVVDGKTIIATGELAIAATDFNVGEPFETGKNDATQIGSVLVFRNGLLQFRNPGNGTTGGNYQEVDPGGGLGTIIRFNNAPVGQADNIQVVSNGVVAERPTASQMAEIEKVQGQVDAMIPTLAALADVEETDFQAAPNNVDLKVFGDILLGLLDMQVPYVTAWQAYTPTFEGVGSPTGVDFWWRQNGDSYEIIGQYIWGVVSATPPRITFPAAGTVKTLPGNQIVGSATSSNVAAGHYNVVVSNTVNKLQITASNAAISGLGNTNANAFGGLGGNGTRFAIHATVPIEELSATRTLREHLQDKGVLP